jgi:hypothetical protein
MKLRAQFEGLAVVAIMAAVLAKETLVKITGDHTVDKAGADDFAIGRVTVAAKAASGEGTVETRFKEWVECKTAGIVAAGNFVKLAAADSGTGENRIVAWDSGADSPTIIYGVCWKGAGNGGVAEVLTF